MSQKITLTDQLGKIGTLGSKPINTPMNPNICFDQNLREPLADPKKYRRLIDKLIYLSVTQSDIIFNVSVLSCYMQSPYKLYWTAACHILW